jgi:hypothetical protein
MGQSIIPGHGVDTQSSTQQHALGTLYKNHKTGKTYVYCVDSGSAIAQYQAVSITPAYACAALTKANADKGYKVGVAPIAVTASYYFWCQILGAGTVRVASACASETTLYTTATAGRLDDASASQTIIKGIELTATAATAAASANAACLMKEQPSAFVGEVTVDANVAAITVASSQASLATLAASSAMSSAMVALSEASSAMSSGVTASSAGSINTAWLSVASEFSSRVVAGSAVDSAGSDCLASNAVYGQLWNTIGSAISSASA